MNINQEHQDLIYVNDLQNIYYTFFIPIPLLSTVSSEQVTTIGSLNPK